MSKRNKLLVLGWDAADWKVINPLIEQGKMPALQKLMKSGISGNLATIEPALSPMLWTSIGTGKYPDKHGILGFTEPNPGNGEPRPVSSTSRKVRAIWNILTQQEYKTHLVGWWPSHPAEPINGIAVSNFYQRAQASINKEWPLIKGTIHPESYEDVFRELRVHPDELTEAHVLPFIPNAHKINQEKDHRIGVLSKILADCASIHAASTWIMENEEWDFIGIYHDAIDHFCHGFMRFHPPKMAGIPDEMFEIYKEVINSAYMFHDMMLERIMQLAGPDTNIILLSDHGFQSDHLRPTALPKEPAGPAYEHRPYGILCMSGPDFKKDEKIYGSTILDITPSILTLLDLPIGKDMDGIPLTNAFNSKKKIKEISSWEDVEGDFGMHDKEIIEDPFAAEEALNQLVELGYIEPPDKAPEKRIKKVKVESKFNLARVYLGSNRPHLAVPILEELLKENREHRFLLRLVYAYQNMSEHKKALKIIEEIKKESENKNWGVEILEASCHTFLGNNKAAMKLLLNIEKESDAIPNLQVQLGHAYLDLKEWQKAEESFFKSFVLDPDKASAHYGIGLSFLRQKKYEDAIEAFLNAVARIYHYPVAHYHLGEALYHMKLYQNAHEAFNVAHTMNPAIVKARKWMEKIEKIFPELKKVEKSDELDIKELNKTEVEKKSKNYKSRLDKSRGELIVVSGLPRTGTSLMMQLLEKGGLPIFTDKTRAADESNPKGYYEHKAIMNSLKNNKWVNTAVDKASKVVSPFLPNLPLNYDYKVIYMRRDFKEVINSQHKMLQKLGKTKEGTYSMGLENAFKNYELRALKWANENSNVNMLFLEYTDVIESPENAIDQINKFLDGRLNTKDMHTVIDKKLYRNRQQLSREKVK